LNCVTKIQSNTFDGNKAGIKGGAVSWNSVEPLNVTDNIFDSSGTTPNIADIFGSNIGSIAETIQFISKEVYDANKNTAGDVDTGIIQMDRNIEVSEHSSGSSIPTKYVGLFNRYGKIVKPIDASPIECTVLFSESKGFTSSLTGTTSYVPTNGVAALGNMVLSSAPATSQKISCSTDNLLDKTATSNISVSVRD